MNEPVENKLTILGHVVAAVVWETRSIEVVNPKEINDEQLVERLNEFLAKTGLKDFVAFIHEGGGDFMFTTPHDGYELFSDPMAFDIVSGEPVGPDYVFMGVI